MDKEFQELLAKLEARDKDLGALVAKANEEAKNAGSVAIETKAAIDKVIEGKVLG